MLPLNIIDTRNQGTDTFGSFAAASMASLFIASTGGLMPSALASVLGSYSLANPACSRVSYRRNQVLGSVGAMQFTFREYTNEVEALPKTPLGKRLMELRARAISKGMPLLSQNDIEAEIATIRGELDIA